MGRALVTGKIPYRDLFEQKGPIVYFVTAFCCLFQNYNLMMFFFETICLSWFFFFAYRICRKRLNTFYSLVGVLILATAIFTSWCRMRSAAAVEEFVLPIYAYFLLCWLEFIIEKRQWNLIRTLCLGLCFGILFWVKYTLLYFIVAPMAIWLILNLRQRRYHTVIKNLLLMLAGFTIITIPIMIFYAAHHALYDLFHVYIGVNLTAYNTLPQISYLLASLSNFRTYIDSLACNFGIFFTIGALILFLIIWGTIRFTIHHWHEKTGWLILIAFGVNMTLLVIFFKAVYYYGQLFPYAIFGVIDVLEMVSNKLTLQRFQKSIYFAVTIICLLVCYPVFFAFHEWGRSIPLQIASTIHAYENETNTKATLFCYKIGDFGFYNTVGVIPEQYYFANNYLSEQRFPEMYDSFRNTIATQSCDFVVTELQTWLEENEFLSRYYTPYTGDITTSTYYYHQTYNADKRDFYFVLLFKI